jgi:PAS domain-containing protein
VIGRPLEKFVPQSGPETNINQCARVLQETGIVDAMVRGKRADNTDIDLEFHAIKIKNDLNFPLETLALLVDRTGTLPAGGADANNPSKGPGPLRYGILLLDPSGRIVSANNEILTLTGHDDETCVLGNPVSSLISAGSECLEAMQNPAGKKYFRKTGFRKGKILHRDGSGVPVRISIRHLHDTTGTHLCTEVVARAEIMMPPATMKETDDAVPMPAFMIDRERRVLWWNSAMESFTGIRKEDMVGTSGYRQAFYPYYGVEPLLIDLVDQPLDKIHQVYPAVKKYGDTIVMERYIPDSKTAEGKYLYEKASLLYDPLGNTIGYMGGVFDITEWKQSREFMNRMKDEMEASLHPRILHLQKMIGNVTIPLSL